MNTYQIWERQTIDDLRMITRRLCNNPKISLDVKVVDLQEDLEFGKVELTKKRLRRIINIMMNIKKYCKE